MIVASWNVRGLNDPQKQVEVRKMRHSKKLNVIALIETRVKAGKATKVHKKWEINGVGMITIIALLEEEYG